MVFFLVDLKRMPAVLREYAGACVTAAAAAVRIAAQLRHIAKAIA